MKNDKNCLTNKSKLKLRLNELLERRDELEREGSFSSEYIISDHDIDFTLPEHLTCVNDVNLAIEMTYYKLFGEYELVNKIFMIDPDDQNDKSVSFGWRIFCTILGAFGFI